MGKYFMGNHYTENSIRAIVDIDPFVRYVAKVCGVRDNYHIPWRVLYDYEIIYMLEGQLTVVQEDKTYTLEAGDFHIMRPFVRHRRYVPEFSESGRNVCTYYNVHFDFFSDAGEDFDVEEVYIRPCDIKLEEAKVLDNLSAREEFERVDAGFEKIRMINVHLLNEYFEQLLAAFGSNAKYCRLRTRGIFLQILAELFESAEMNDSGFRYNTAVRQFIMHTLNYYSEEFDILKLCNLYGFSPNYFRRLFKKATHKTPLEYLTEVRVEHAKKLIVTGNYTIGQVSEMVGYDDPYYFSKIFKKSTGFSPKKYAEQNASGNGLSAPATGGGQNITQ